MQHIESLIRLDSHVLDLPIAEARTTLGRVHVLGSPTSNAKLAKGGKDAWQTVGLSLAPSTQAGLGVTTCGQEGVCARYCVAGSGNAITFDSVTIARNNLTALLAQHPAAFLRVLVEDVRIANERAASVGERLALRLNVFSDIAWERVVPELFEIFAAWDVPVYDYTKRLDRFDDVIPANYTLIASHSERTGLASNPFLLHDFISRGINVAVPFDVVRGHPLPATHHGVTVVDGDASDLRHLDPRGVIVGLRSKVTRNGKASAETGRGFVLPVLQG